MIPTRYFLGDLPHIGSTELQLLDQRPGLRVLVNGVPVQIHSISYKYTSNRRHEPSVDQTDEHGALDLTFRQLLMFPPLHQSSPSSSRSRAENDNEMDAVCRFSMSRNNVTISLQPSDGSPSAEARIVVQGPFMRIDSPGSKVPLERVLILRFAPGNQCVDVVQDTHPLPVLAERQEGSMPPGVSRVLGSPPHSGHVL